ncbi:MAG: transposase [Minisyncoccia bacterium]|jgi:putative transposase
MKKPTFVTGEIYHVYNRGVEKREVFLEPSDYFRMIHDLYELNDRDAVLNSQYCSRRNSFKQKGGRAREILVEILAFVLMPNHYHLALRQVEENGIVKFMQKLGTGYTNYFNKKTNRVGPLFQGSFKATYIDTDDYLRNLLGYIHTNPATLVENYRSSTSIISSLEKYRWSSFPDYIGIKNFPSITSRKFLLEVMGGSEGVRASADAWLTHRGEKSGTVPEIIEVELR